MPKKLTLLQSPTPVASKSRINRLVSIWNNLLDGSFSKRSHCNGIDNSTKYSFIKAEPSNMTIIFTSWFQVIIEWIQTKHTLSSSSVLRSRISGLRGCISMQFSEKGWHTYKQLLFEWYKTIVETSCTMKNWEDSQSSSCLKPYPFQFSGIHTWPHTSTHTIICISNYQRYWKKPEPSKITYFLPSHPTTCRTEILQKQLQTITCTTR